MEFRTAHEAERAKEVVLVSARDGRPMQLAKSLFTKRGGKALTAAELEVIRQVALDNGHDECVDIVQQALDLKADAEALGAKTT